MTGRFLLPALVALAAVAAYVWWPASGAMPTRTGHGASSPALSSEASLSSAPAVEIPEPGKEAMPPPAMPRFSESTGPNLFPAQSFRPPRIQAAARVVAPPPMAPDLPFTYVGAWTEQGRETVFLSQGDAVLSAHLGEDLPGGWRLDSVEPDSLTFTYLSLNQQRNLRIAP